MFLIKLVDSVLIILVCSYIGINKSRYFTFRVNNLRNLKSSFNMFKTKLMFTYEPIQEVFHDISKTIYADKDNIFKSYIENLKNDNYEDSWNLSVAENSYGFTKEDIGIINGFGNLLGKTDLNGQLNEVELAEQFLDKQIIDAEEERKKNNKLYKSLGIIIFI